jgi:hypothetical protein
VIVIRTKVTPPKLKGSSLTEREREAVLEIFTPTPNSDAKDLLRIYDNRLFLAEPWQYYEGAHAENSGNHVYMIERRVDQLHARIFLPDQYGRSADVGVGFFTWSNKNLTGRPHKLIRCITDLVDVGEYLRKEGMQVPIETYSQPRVFEYRWNIPLHAKSDLERTMHTLTKAQDWKHGDSR